MAGIRNPGDPDTALSGEEIITVVDALAGELAKDQLTKLMKTRKYKLASEGPDGRKALAIKQIFAAVQFHWHQTAYRQLSQHR